MVPSVLDVLDRLPDGGDEDRRRTWSTDVERSLAEQPDEWCRAVGPVPYYGIAQGHA